MENDIERLQLANNGLIEVTVSGPMCWYEDYAAVVKNLEEVTSERDQYKRACELNDALANARRLTVTAAQ